MRTPGTESNVKRSTTSAPSSRATRRTRSSTSSASSATTSDTGAAPARHRAASSKRRQAYWLRLAGFVAASGPSGTLGAGDYLKEKYAKIAAVEAVECPTLLNNGYGEHNIQGIGDKHVPLIHNVMNTDFVIGVSDQAIDGLNAVFNTAAAPTRAAHRRFGGTARYDAWFAFQPVQPARGDQAARHQRLGLTRWWLRSPTAPHSTPVSCATTSSETATRQSRARLCSPSSGRHLAADTQYVLEATTRARAHLQPSYFTWVEQQACRSPTSRSADRRRSARPARPGPPMGR